MLTSGRFRRRQLDPDSDDDDDDDDGHPHGGADVSQEYLMGQTKCDIWMAHAICGCYTRDYPLTVTYDDDDRITFCTKIFRCFTSSCCGAMGGMNLQFCGFCAVAQEGRELESLMQAGRRRIDYVTMQPMMEYYPAIYEARHSQSPSSWWFHRLSKLSRWCIYSCIIWISVLFLWSMLSIPLNHNFKLANFMVFCLTLLQAFGFLTLVYWKHSKDISIDAVIKFFACGFCLSTTLGIFFELLVGLVIRLTMSLLMAMSGLDIVEDNGYSSSSKETVSTNMWSAEQVNYSGVNYREYLQVFGNDHPFVFTVYLFVTSFILAAFIEELCKYFGYRMVDHPDFHTQEGVEEAMDYREEEEVEVEQPFATSFPDQNRTYQSRGAAITVAMVAAGLGFACCENLVYIFVYGNSDVGMEATILIARSLFPIHPIAAAIQSIGVCKRDLEKDSKVRLGRVILPGIIFHGLYDFAILWIHYLGNRKGNYFNDNNGVNFSTESGSQKASTIVSAVILLGGIYYYVMMSRKQRLRLKGMDGELTDMEARLT
jgi:RsiW-degrading membrane proteinase PrsW (M82 family)